MTKNSMTKNSSTEDSITVHIDGVEHSVPAGHTVAAAVMLADGRLGWRSTRNEHKPRGLFCGIGVCYDCLATVDGHPGLRTCMVEARDGMEIQTTHPQSGGNGGGNDATTSD